MANSLLLAQQDPLGAVLFLLLSVGVGALIGYSIAQYMNWREEKDAQTPPDEE